MIQTVVKQSSGCQRTSLQALPETYRSHNLIQRIDNLVKERNSIFRTTTVCWLCNLLSQNFIHFPCHLQNRIQGSKNKNFFFRKQEEMQLERQQAWQNSSMIYSGQTLNWTSKLKKILNNNNNIITKITLSESLSRSKRQTSFSHSTPDCYYKLGEFQRTFESRREVNFTMTQPMGEICAIPEKWVKAITLLK